MKYGTFIMFMVQRCLHRILRPDHSPYLASTLLHHYINTILTTSGVPSPVTATSGLSTTDIVRMYISTDKIIYDKVM